MIERGLATLNACLVWDNHACMPLRPDDHGFLNQLERLTALGVDVVTLNIGFGPQPRADHLRMLDSFDRWLHSQSERYRRVLTVQDIELARDAGKLGILFDVEGMAILDDGSLEQIGRLRARGVGWMLVAYNRNNAAGGGCLDVDTGLSAHGRRILAEMKRVGMIACCSHTGHRTAWDVLEAADNPVIFSHSNASVVRPHARNIPDELIVACAETGGVVGVNGIGDFLGDGTDYVELLIRHIDHMVQRVGPAHVGLSLDYAYDVQEVLDYLHTMPETLGGVVDGSDGVRMAPPEVLPGLVAGLLERGYSEDDLAAILGGNWLRVAGQVWPAAMG